MYRNICVAVPQNYVKWNDLDLALNNITKAKESNPIVNPVLIIIPILISWTAENVLQAQR